MNLVPETLRHKDQDVCDPEIIKVPPFRQRRTPFVVTIVDPKIAHVDIHKMIESGANGLWLKTELSTIGDKIRLIGKVDKAVDFLTKKYGMIDWPVFTVMELKTCIVNTGILDNELEHLYIKEGLHVTLTSDIAHYNKCNRKLIFVDNPFLAAETKVGTTLNINCDEIVLKCKEVVNETTIKCLVTKGGNLKNVDFVCTRGVKKARPVITKKDLQIVKFALDQKIDVIIINYPRNADTFRRVKKFIDNHHAKRPLLFAGLCTQEGMSNIDSLIRESDGLVMSREFLAYELQDADVYRMMQIQKWAGAKCHQAGKPFYLSGGVFRHTLLTGKMIQNEIQNFTNALLEGVSGYIVKLCPNVDIVVEVLKTMDSICCANEPLVGNRSEFWRIHSEVKMPINAAEGAALACVVAANQCNARVIILPTVTGRTARAIMWFKPACIIMTISTRLGSTRRLQTQRCIVPLLYKGAVEKMWQSNQEARINFAEEFAVKKGWLVYGDTYVTLQRGSEDSCFCDTVRLWKVTTSNKPIVQCQSDEDFYKSLVQF